MTEKYAFNPCQEPGQASAEAGYVLLDGPDGVAVSMTARAARLTADSLYRAAHDAERDQAAPQPPPLPDSGAA